MKAVVRIIVIGIVFVLASCTEDIIEEFVLHCNDYDGSQMESTTYEVGATITGCTEPTREGYTFVGWDTEVLDIMPAHDITLVAEYEVEQYDLSFLHSDGSVIDTLEVDYGTDITSLIPVIQPMEGYTASWDTEVASTMPSDSLTYQVVYEINEYRISFDVNGGSNVPSIRQDYGSSVEAPTDPERDGYLFDGWYTDETYTELYVFTTIPSHNTSVYAKWTRMTFSEYINEYLEDTGFNGSALIYVDEETLLDNGYGWANVANHIENTPTTRFCIGSITKQFTAVAIMMLYEDGLLHLDDTLDMYIPEFPNGDIITIHHLLSHTSGLQNYFDYIPWDSPDYKYTGHTPLSIIGLIWDAPLNFNPGDDFEYSNSNYFILGHIIEVITETTYQDFMMQNIFLPLQMNDTFFSTMTPGPNDALGYMNIVNDTSEPEVFRHPSISFSSGSMVSTTGDLLLWHHALMNHVLLTEETMALMYTPYSDPVGYSYGYGYGWHIMSAEGPPKLFHSGNSQQFVTYYYRATGTDKAVILISNEHMYDIESLLFYIFDAFLEYDI